MSDEKNLWEALKECFPDIGLTEENIKCRMAWPVIAGPRLSACTSLMRIDAKKRRIVVKPDSISSRSLLIMEKERIRNDWNRMLPDVPIDVVAVSMRY